MRHIAAAILILCLFAGTANAETLTLKQAIDIASEKNRDIQKAREYIRWVEGKYVEERSAAFPTVTLNASLSRQHDLTTAFLTTTSKPANYYDSREADFTVTQTLYSWGKVGAAIRAAKAGLKSADEQLRQYRQAAIKDVSTAFYDSLLSKEFAEIAREDLARKQARLDESRRRLQAGAATDYDVLVADVTTQNTRPELIRAENTLRRNLDQLRLLLALDTTVEVSGTLVVDETAPCPTLDEIYQAALSQRPELLDMRYNIEVAREAITIYNAEDKPQISLKGGYGSQNITSNGADLPINSWNVGLYLTYPIFNGLQTRGKVAEAESDLRKMQLEEAKLKDAIRNASSDALNSLIEAREIIRASSGTVQQAERLLYLTNKGFELGVNVRLDVEDAEQKLRQAKGNRARAWRDYNVAQLNVQWVMGVIGQ